MSSIQDAIARGLQKSREGRSRRVSRFFSTPASPDKLIRLFFTECISNEYGEPVPLSKKTRGMMSGFIKLGRNNGWKEEKFYSIIKSIVINWGELRKKDLTSLNGKRIVLSDRPSLLEFLIGRDSILSALYEIENRPEVVYEMDMETTSDVESIESSQDDSLEAEMQKEYERMMDRMTGE